MGLVANLSTRSIVAAILLFLLIGTVETNAASLRLQYSNQNTGSSIQSPSFQLKVFNDSSSSIDISRIEVRYWYTEEGTSGQTANLWYAGILPAGTEVTSHATKSIQTTSLGGQTHYLKMAFTTGGGSVPTTGWVSISAAFNKNDWSNYTQTNDYSFSTQTAYADYTKITVYLDGTLVWGTEPGSGPVATLTVTPTSTFTKTPAPNTSTSTTSPTKTSTLTNTPINSSTSTSTVTPTLSSTSTITPSRTATATSTFTLTPVPVIALRLQYWTSDRGDSVQSPHFQVRVYNNGNVDVDLSHIEIRYWFAEEGSQSQSVIVDWAGHGLSGSGITDQTTGTIAAANLGGQTNTLNFDFISGAGIVQPGDYVEVHARYNKSDWSNYSQGNDYSFSAIDSFQDWNKITVYLDGALKWGVEPVGVNTSTPTAIPTSSPSSTPTSIQSPISSGIGLIAKLNQVNNQTNTNSAQFQVKLENIGAENIDLHQLELRYWILDASTQPLQAFVDWAGVIPTGTSITSVVSPSIQLWPSGGQTNVFAINFLASAPSFTSGMAVELHLRMNREDWSYFDQTDDYSFSNTASYLPWRRIAVYYKGLLIWGYEPTVTKIDESAVSDIASSRIGLEYWDSSQGSTQVHLNATLKNFGCSSILLEDLELRYWAFEPEPLQMIAGQNLVLQENSQNYPISVQAAVFATAPTIDCNESGKTNQEVRIRFASTQQGLALNLGSIIKTSDGSPLAFLSRPSGFTLNKNAHFSNPVYSSGVPSPPAVQSKIGIYIKGHLVPSYRIDPDSTIVQIQSLEPCNRDRSYSGATPVTVSQTIDQGLSYKRAFYQNESKNYADRVILRTSLENSVNFLKMSIRDVNGNTVVERKHQKLNLTRDALVRLLADMDTRVFAGTAAEVSFGADTPREANPSTDDPQYVSARDHIRKEQISSGWEKLISTQYGEIACQKYIYFFPCPLEASGVKSVEIWESGAIPLTGIAKIIYSSVEIHSGIEIPNRFEVQVE